MKYNSKVNYIGMEVVLI